ncbi:MAG: gamma-glutamyltransferase [Gammaproteobacteria bacterium]|nr:gamma-glutamyltransferase [Gammaproteobacteria bacterium]
MFFKQIPFACILLSLSLHSAAAQERNAVSGEPLGPYGLDRDAYIVRYKEVFAPVVGREGMVSTQSDIATGVGVQILNQGGNAIDAAVAVGFVLAVTLPRAGNLGGGGFMLVHANGETESIDYRETAPATVTAQDFLDENSEKDLASRFRWPAVGVPGTVAGFRAAWEKYGSLDWEPLLQPAIDLAESGFPVSYDLAEILATKKSWLKQDPGALNAFYPGPDRTYAPGDIMKRPDLAETLKLIQADGTAPFYTGSIARKIVKASQQNGGHFTLDDLANYKAVFRPVLKGRYRSYEIAAMPPPSSGGVAIIETLNILEQFPVSDWGYSADYVHVLVEALRLAFADRGTHLADPDFADVPVDRLIDKDYALTLAEKIQMTKSLELDDGEVRVPEPPSTTHYSIVDSGGNAVSNTYTLSSSFGAGIVVPETGILMNNQIHTFSVRAGIPGATGFMASHANRVEGGKRPVSSQSPTIVLKEGKPFLVVGSPGGSRIITAVVQVISNVIDHGMNIAAATNQRRIHHQWVPNVLEVEPGFNIDTARLLEAKGHDVKTTFTMGSTQSILVSRHYLYGASDPRRPNAKTMAAD